MNAKPDEPSSRFLNFLQEYKKIVVAILAIGATPPMLTLILGVGPPWPDQQGVSYFSTLVVWLVLPWTYIVTSGAQHFALRRRCTIIGFTCVVALFAYVCLAAAFVYDAPDNRHQESRGFLLRDTIARTLVEAEKQGIPLDLDDLVEGAQWDPTRIWIPWTVAVTRTSLLVAWLLLFGSLSSLTALLLRFLETEVRTERTGRLDEHVSSLSLPRNLCRLLEDSGIQTVGDVTKRRREELLAIPGFGQRALATTEERLTSKGLSLKE